MDLTKWAKVSLPPPLKVREFHLDVRVDRRPEARPDAGVALPVIVKALDPPYGIPKQEDADARRSDERQRSHDVLVGL